MPPHRAPVGCAPLPLRPTYEPWFSTSTGHSRDRVKPNYARLSKQGHEERIKPVSASLALPQPHDDQSTLLAKLTAIADVVTNNQSVATATTYCATPSSERNPEKAASAKMSPTEYESWKAYLDGKIQLPHIDWETDKETPPTSKRGLRTARCKAEALNRLYLTDQAQPDHSMWFTKMHPECLPLVKAMARIIGMKKNIVGGQCESDENDLADLQSLNKIIASSVRTQHRHQSASKSHNQAIKAKLQILINHKRQLQDLRTQSKKRKMDSTSQNDDPNPKRIFS